MRSIERHLLVWMTGALSVGLLAITLVVYFVTLDEMNEVFDADLKNVAGAVLSHHHAARQAFDDGDPAPLVINPMQDDSDILTVVWTRDGRRLVTSDPAIALPFIDTEGLARLNVRGQEWIIYTAVRNEGVAQAAQPASSRQQMAGESAASVLLPMLLLVLLASGLMILALRRGLHSLDVAALDVAARSESSLEPIPTGELPREIRPIVDSVNGLMSRLATSLTAQREFLADAAHELRTPATALKLQLQLLERATDESTREQAMHALHTGVERAQRLIEQLLQVARSGMDGEPIRHDDIDLGALVREVVGQMSVKAEDRGIDLGASADADVIVRGDGEQLTVLLNNLVENALRYTPRGGVVDVYASTREGCPVLGVVDNGQGIPESEHHRVFDRFHRGEARPCSDDDVGSGLGLAIVRAIADRHGASIALTTPASGRGLQVEVVFGGRTAGRVSGPSASTATSISRIGRLS